MAQSEDRRIGTVLGGRYRLLSVIGSGGMGAVYRAEHLVLKKELAVKLLHSYLRVHPRGEELHQRFLREAEWLARLDQHPHMVAIVDGGIAEDGTLYMAMELCEGEPLCDVLARGPLPPARALHITVQILRALIHAHGHGIIHRDLKPDNIMLTRRDGREDFVKVLDFGIAKLISDTSQPDESPPPADGLPADPASPAPASPVSPPARALTEAGIIFGTPEYLAPEQARGLLVDQRADLYSVGVMLWEMLVGRRPFPGQTALEVISQHVSAVPHPPSEYSPGELPQELDEVVLRAMAKDPAERFASAEEFLRALDVVLPQVGPAPGRIITPLLTGIRRSLTGTVRRLGPQEVPAAGPQAPPSDGSGRPPSRARGRSRRRWTSLAGAWWERRRQWLSALGLRLGVRGTALAVALSLVVGFVVISTLAVRLGHYLSRRHPPAALVQAPPALSPGAAGSRDGGAGGTAPAQIPLEVLIERLEQGRSCQERRSAALALMARQDPQALTPLMRARQRATGRNARNGCMLRDLDDAISLLQAQVSPDGGTH